MIKTFKTAVSCWLLAFSCWLLALPANSQEQIANSQKVITRSTMLGFGRTNILDTYLSAEHFKGSGISFVNTIERQRPEKRWSTLMEHEANFSMTKDRAKTQQEMEGAYNFYWGKLYSWQLFDNSLKLQAGGLVNASLGFIYNTSNGNNPAQARAHLNVMPTGVATYKFNLWNKPLTARYEVALPLCGIMFSPNYGQSYYEIFSLGNYDHNAVPTTFDVRLWKSAALRIGYLGNMQQAKVNNLRQHVYTHRLLIGFTKQFSIIPRSL